ncbi:hypothetical protein EON81_25850 [bacterium]|nr:MAG: hypothetical protein EON81_25850 [bacterium]
MTDTAKRAGENRRTILDMSDARGMFDDLLMHWSGANAGLGSRPIELTGGYTRARFLEQAVRFDHMAEEIEAATQDRNRVGEDLIHYKVAVRKAIERLSYLVPGLADGTEFARRFPSVPDHRSSEAKFLATVDKVAELWTAHDGEHPTPLVLPDGTTSRDFARGVVHLRKAFRVREEATQRERGLRDERRALHKSLVERAVQYRKVIQALGPEHEALITSLPYLWPKQDRRKKTTVPA